MGLPLASMYAKSHDNYYIPVHSRVFFLFLLLLFTKSVRNKHSKKCTFYINSFPVLPHLNLRLYLGICCWDARMKILLCFIFLKDLRDLLLPSHFQSLPARKMPHMQTNMHG